HTANRELLKVGCLLSSMFIKQDKKGFCQLIDQMKKGLIFADTNETGLELMKIKYSKVDKDVLYSYNNV
ncbi:MAG TPA: hypothetical protein VIK55_01555, partial [Paludibacter sp.]